MIDEIISYSLGKYTSGNNVKVHFSRLDTDDEYNALVGVFVNGELDETFELENVTNHLLDDYESRIRTEFSKRTLYLI